MSHSTAHSRSSKVLASFAFARPAQAPRQSAAEPSKQAVRRARSLPHEALLWLAPYLASLAVILLIGI